MELNMIQDDVVLRYGLLETFQQLGQDFEGALSDAKQQEQQFKNECQEFQNTIQIILTQAAKNLSSKNPLSTQVAAFMDLLSDTSDRWGERIRKQDTGVRFREDFDDSLLIFVYGKVKSGKSSLGNYVAWGHTDPTAEIKLATPSNLQPKYFSGEKTNAKNGDQAQEAELKKEFRVGATEATSSIQGFKLPGLTWIDSPGLHSINAQNGQLAKDYVDHADLILYTMKSDSPGRESDLAEIRELYRAEKRILLLLTGSDDTNPTGFDAQLRKPIVEIVMKESDRRKSQRDYIRTALNQIPELHGKTNNIEIVSFSARYAQLHDKDKEAFQDSGLGELFQVIHETAETEGVRLKKQTPLKNFKNFIDKFRKDLAIYERAIEDFQLPIRQLRKSVPQQVQTCLYDMQSQMSNQINQEFGHLEQFRNEAQVMQHSLKEINNRLNQFQKKLLIDAQEKVVMQLMNEFGNQMVHAFENSALSALPEFNIETQTETIISGVRPNTKKRNGGIGAVAGALIGGLVGSVIPVVGTGIGATVGSALGSMSGAAIGDSATSLTKDITINIGDNLGDIHEKTLLIFRDFLQNQMLNFQENLLQISLEDAEALIQNLSHQLVLMQKKMTDLNHMIDSKLTV